MNSRRTNQRGGVQRVNLGYPLREGHADHALHVHLCCCPILAASHLQVLPQLLWGPSSAASLATEWGWCRRLPRLLCEGRPSRASSRWRGCRDLYGSLKNMALIRQQLCKMLLSSSALKLIYLFHMCQNMSDITSVIS